MRHVFKGKKLGWGDDKTEGVGSMLTTTPKKRLRRSQALSRGYSERYDYTGYEYDGERYHHYTYLGEFEDDDMLPVMPTFGIENRHFPSI